jgi:hypothetical protein
MTSRSAAQAPAVRHAVPSSRRWREWGYVESWFSCILCRELPIYHSKALGLYNQGGALMHHGKLTTAREAIGAHGAVSVQDRGSEVHMKKRDTYHDVLLFALFRGVPLCRS